MKKLILLLSVAFLTIMGASADTYNYLNFVTANNQITQVSTTGLKMTFNAGKATVTTGGQTQTINLAQMAYMEFTNTQSSGGTTYLTGDVNGDGSIDVVDINILINIMLGKDTTDYEGRQYVNGGTTVDVSDVNIVINLMLGKG